MARDISRRSAGQHPHTSHLSKSQFFLFTATAIDLNIPEVIPSNLNKIISNKYNKMANFSGPTFEFRTTGKAIEWGYPAGASIVDLVPEDMRGVIHSHWKSFPPVLTKKIFIKI